MDQNQTVDNDLQKAIDDITNTTSVDPVFSDPVAAPSSIPEGDTGELGEPVGPFPEPTPIMAPPVAPEPTIPSEPTMPPEPSNIPDFNIPPLTPPAESTPTETPVPNMSTGLNMHQVKEAALRDLIPILDKITLDSTQKFNIYRDIFENLRDYTVLEAAYNAAREIPDDTKRAEALLYLVESIDKM
ncbi:hypothetical protein IKF26_02905 [Candidatus Saccharibacteria bacterium]|nr:hypothetical protein [Candidatus Saccharibacteria bacterium]